MPRDLPDVWRDEDGPHEAELDRWTSGEVTTLTVDLDRRRILRWALKSAWADATLADRATIDEILSDLK